MSILIRVLIISEVVGIGKVEVFGGGSRSDPNKRNNPRKQNNNLVVNRDIGKKPTGIKIIYVIIVVYMDIGRVSTVHPNILGPISGIRE